MLSDANKIIDVIGAYCAELISANPWTSDEDLNEEGHIKRKFGTNYAGLISKWHAHKRKAHELQRQLGELESRSWLKRFFDSATEASVRARLTSSHSECLALEAELKAAVEAHRANPLVISAVRKHMAELEERRRVRDIASSIRNEIFRLKNKLSALLRQHPGLPVTLPSLTVSQVHTLRNLSLEQIGMVANSLRAVVEEQVPVLLNIFKAKQAAADILVQLQEGATDTRPPYPPAFVAKSEATLKSLFKLGPESVHVDKLLAQATDPRLLRNAESWLVLWTALAATSRYAETNEGLSTSEDPRAYKWCEAWRAQFLHWGKLELSALGINSKNVQSAICEFQNSQGEHRTGADILVVMLVELPGRRYVSAIAIQFKRNTNDTPGIPLNQNEWEQYRSLRQLQTCSNGRIQAIHALVRNVADGIATIPAVPLSRSLDFLRAGTINPYFEGKAMVNSVNWKSLGEALPPLIAECLTRAESQFENVEALFEWFETNPAVPLPNFMIVQSLGSDSLSLTHALRKGKRLAASRGYSYREPPISREIKPQRGVERDNGPSLSR